MSPKKPMPDFRNATAILLRLCTLREPAERGQEDPNLIHPEPALRPVEAALNSWTFATR